MIDELGLPWLLRGHRQTFLPREHIDQGGLPHIGAPDEGILREARRGALTDLTIADDELCRLDDHKLLTIR